MDGIGRGEDARWWVGCGFLLVDVLDVHLVDSIGKVNQTSRRRSQEEGDDNA